VDGFPSSIQNAITFLRVVRFSWMKKFKDPILPPPLREDRRKHTLVLDLDETLMHCSPNPLKERSPDFTVTFEGNDQEGYIYVRPYATQFLAAVSKSFEVAIFTASTQPYADQVLDRLDPTRKHIRHRLYRPQCSEEQSGFVKDLRHLGRELRQTVIVDNSPISLAYQLDNGVVVSTWTGDDNDEELIDLLALLEELSREPDVTLYLNQRYGLREWVNSERQEDPL